MSAKRLIRFVLKGGALALTLLGGGLAAAALLTLRFGDRALWPPPADQKAIVVYLVSHGYHSGVVVPRAFAGEVAARSGQLALGMVVQRFSAYPWLEIGWGDEGFYTQVPTIGALTVTQAARALFLPGNPSVLHVVGLQDEARAMFPHADIMRLDLGEMGFVRLLAKVDASFARKPEGPPKELGPGLYGPSLFYRAAGTFNIFNVCNHWVANLLDAAGVPTAPVLATLPDGLLLDLKWRSGLRLMPRPTP